MKFSPLHFILNSLLTVALGLYLALPGRATAQSWTSTNLFNDWTSLAMTSDGRQIAADSFLGGIYTSTDGGNTWTEVGVPDFNHWSVLAAAANGGNLVAAYNGGGIYTSPDWGLDWQSSGAPVDNWTCLASSWDGTRLVAGVSPGMIYTSRDAGATFTSRLPPNTAYQAIAASADGANLVAVVQGGGIFRSTDSGDTWAATPAPTAYWSGITVSTNGLNLAAVASGTGIFTSTDAGNTWTLTPAANITGVPNTTLTNWSAIAASADGSRLVAAVSAINGLIYTSTDAGLDWTANTVPSNYWSAVYSSPDGARLLALANGGGGAEGESAYTSTNSSAYVSTNAGATWSPLEINPGPYTNNLVCSEFFSLTVISSNLSTHLFTTNLFGTNLINLGVLVSGNREAVTNEVACELTGTTNLTSRGDIAVSGLLGLNAAGVALFGPALLNTNLLGSKLFGTGFSTPSMNLTNVAACSLTFTSDHTGMLATTNLIQVLVTNLSGLSVILSNSLNLQIVRAIVPQSWSAIAASADGGQWVAAVNGGWIYTSTNAGVTWTNNAGWVRISTNSGVIWTSNLVSSPNLNWTALACSADGSKLVAAVANGGIFTAVNSGAVWVSNSLPWQIQDGEIATTTNTLWQSQGMVWVSNNIPSQVWSAVSSSPDGYTLVALARSGWSYKSTNGGATWNELSAPDDFWQSVASSASGSSLLAASQSGYVYQSTNAGASWSELVIALGATNVLSADTFSFTLTYTNFSFNPKGQGSATNAFVTNAFGPFVSIPSLVISNNLTVSSPGLDITNAVGLSLFTTNAAGTNVLSAFLGVDIQGSNVFAFSPVATDPLGTGTLGTAGAHVTNVLLPYLSFSNVVTANLAIPDGTGPFHSNGVAKAALTNVFNANLSDLDPAITNRHTLYLSISNVHNLNVTIANVRQNWSVVASSADGSHLAAAVNGGLIYVSTNAGVTWTPTSAPATNWSALVMSADGTQLTAAVNGGLLYSSTNSGATWNPANVPAADWSALTASADGADLVAVVQGGVIYSVMSGATATNVPALQIQAAPGGVVLAWPAGTASVVLQQNTDLAGSVWMDVPTAPIVTNGQNQVTLPLATPQALYRLRSQ